MEWVERRQRVNWRRWVRPCPSPFPTSPRAVEAPTHVEATGLRLRRQVPARSDPHWRERQRIPRSAGTRLSGVSSWPLPQRPGGKPGQPNDCACRGRAHGYAAPTQFAPAPSSGHCVNDPLGQPDSSPPGLKISLKSGPGSRLRMTPVGCGFNRSTQRIGQIAAPVFQSLASFVAVR